MARVEFSGVRLTRDELVIVILARFELARVEWFRVELDRIEFT